MGDAVVDEDLGFLEDHLSNCTFDNPLGLSKVIRETWSTSRDDLSSPAIDITDLHTH